VWSWASAPCRRHRGGRR